jgi:membrane fusion protein (multidrug efflux system)
LARLLVQEFASPGKYANEVKVGSIVSFTLEGDRSKQYSATVYATANSIDANTRTLTVRATTNNSANQLKPGAFINVQLTLSKSAGTILVPTEAVVPTATGHMVFLKQLNVAQPVNIIIGTRTSTQVQVFEGLKAGDTLITTGTQFVKPGSELNIVTLAKTL